MKFRTADARALPFADGHFAVVVMNKVTHHVPDWRQAVREALRVLEPGGHLVYSDLVLPFGPRFPSRRALQKLATDQWLTTVKQSRFPFSNPAVLRKPL